MRASYVDWSPLPEIARSAVTQMMQRGLSFDEADVSAGAERLRQIAVFENARVMGRILAY